MSLKAVSADSANIARYLPLMAARQPGHPAVKIPRGRMRAGDIDYLVLTFAELAAEVEAWGARLVARGVRSGDRALVMVRQGLPLIAATFALFKLGAVPVVIDPGMGLRNFLACVARSRPRVLLGFPFAQLVSFIFQKPFQTVEVRVTASSSMTTRLAESQAENQKSKMAECSADTLAAILFTSGSTGSPKGVCYEHGMFDAQVRLIRDTYAIEPGEIDLPMLPIFALFDPAFGMTTVVPELIPAARPLSPRPKSSKQSGRRASPTPSAHPPSGEKLPTIASRVVSCCRASAGCSARARPCRRRSGPMPRVSFRRVNCTVPTERPRFSPSARRPLRTSIPPRSAAPVWENHSRKTA